jgi:hypothetical protein
MHMRRITTLNLAFLLLLAALPLISLGASGGQDLLWQVGFLLLLVGLLIPPGLRLRSSARDPKDEPDVEEEPS